MPAPALGVNPAGPAPTLMNPTLQKEICVQRRIVNRKLCWSLPVWLQLFPGPLLWLVLRDSTRLWIFLEVYLGPVTPRIHVDSSREPGTCSPSHAYATGLAVCLLVLFKGRGCGPADRAFSRNSFIFALGSNKIGLRLLAGGLGPSETHLLP